MTFLNTKKLTLTAIFSAAAIAMSTLENLVPIGALIPVPGLKLGIANIAVMAAVYFIGKRAGAAVALLKVSVIFLTFGNVSSLFISAAGTLLAYISLVLTKKAFRKYLSFISISAISAVCHGIGQVLAASIITGSLATLTVMLPLGLCSVATGALTGFLMNCIYVALEGKIKL